MSTRCRGDSMSFLNIKDPQKRDAIVANYLATVKRIQRSNLDERSKDLVQSEAIEQNLEPVVRSTNESTKAITNQLIPIKEHIATLNNNLVKTKQVDEDEDTVAADTSPFIEKIYKKYPNKVDKYFGIVKDRYDHYKMGDKIVHINGEDIIVEGKSYKGTQGFWNLVMMRSPKNTHTTDDLRNYHDLIIQTNAMEHPNNLTVDSNVKATTKWQRIFPLFNTMNNEQMRNAEKSGNGVVQFLPGDIKGLQTKLCYLLGEFRAGNTITREEIVPISDELLRRKKISLDEYKRINSFIQKQ